MLAVDLDKPAGDGAQGLGAHRLVVDEGAGAPIGHLDTAKDQLPVGLDVLGASRGKGGMIGGQIEDGRHLALGFAVADERAVAAGPKAQREGIEQDRFAGARLAGQHGEAGAEFEIEPVDQHDIADGELNEHDCPSPAAAGPDGARRLSALEAKAEITLRNGGKYRTNLGRAKAERVNSARWRACPPSPSRGKPWKSKSSCPRAAQARPVSAGCRRPCTRANQGSCGRGRRRRSAPH